MLPCAVVDCSFSVLCSGLLGEYIYYPFHVDGHLNRFQLRVLQGFCTFVLVNLFMHFG